MKSILLTALCAVAISTQAKVANDTIDKYIIDKQPVEHFDGSQLEGKRIVTYSIDYKENGNAIIKNHVISTDGAASVVKSGIVDRVSARLDRGLYGTEPLIIVDGNVTSKEDFAKMNSTEIVNITVLKPDPAIKIWGSKGSNGVIQVTTKADNSNEATQFNINKYLIIVDGKETPLAEFNKMKPKSSAEYAEKFASMEIFEPGSKEAKSYGEKGKNGVLIVKTKGGK